MTRVPVAERVMRRNLFISSVIMRNLVANEWQKLGEKLTQICRGIKSLKVMGI